ncbi:ABC transporter permease subunit [Bifidobacterium moukalabense]|uniref:ABC transporter permease subunit n=1 Tax=Bifidobacterium moukalabense TaxID=1333651 RepID=UPI0014856E97
MFGINVGALAGGSLVVENIFALPGMGATMMKAILTRDYPVVQVCASVRSMNEKVFVPPLIFVRPIH